MSDVPEEPASEVAAQAWIAEQTGTRDPFVDVLRLSDRHRAEHGCTVYPTADARLLGVLAGAVAARRTLEVGCGLGYSTLWLAYGSAPDGQVETVEEDETHAAIARDVFHSYGYGKRITLDIAPYEELLPRLEAPFDMVFYDAAIPGPADLDQFARLLRSGGLLISSNLFLGRYNLALPQLSQGAEYRRRLLDDDRWLTSFAGLKAVSVRR